LKAVREAPTLDDAVRKELLRVNEQALGIAFGLLLGSGLFIATILLIVKGGADVGAHLKLLHVYFPGYQVTVMGSFIGFVYAFVAGYGLGRTVGLVYNALVDRTT
jgi:hypothetical protein